MPCSRVATATYLTSSSIEPVKSRLQAREHLVYRLASVQIPTMAFAHFIDLLRFSTLELAPSEPQSLSESSRHRASEWVQGAKPSCLLFLSSMLFPNSFPLFNLILFEQPLIPSPKPPVNACMLRSSMYRIPLCTTTTSHLQNTDLNASRQEVEVEGKESRTL